LSLFFVVTVNVFFINLPEFM